MSNPLEMLEVVDENDNVIDLENRLRIHQEGLLHREIHIWFITPNGEIILQHRSKNKDTNADKLDATVGGHVEPGMSYEATAIKECKEETGINIDPGNLAFLGKVHRKSFDNVKNLTNNVIRCQYGYLYTDSISDLKIEEGSSEGFETWKIDNLSKLSDEDKDKFLSFIYSDEMLNLFKKAKELLIK